MEENIINAWASGLFEGEGSFSINKGVSKGINLSSTDLDVLERLKLYFGGSIYAITKRKDHWKDAWIWSIRGKESKDFYEKIKPFLLKRRLDRGEYWINNFPKEKINNEEKIIKMFNDKKTHKYIAESLGLERSTISKFLNRRGLNRLK